MAKESKLGDKLDSLTLRIVGQTKRTRKIKHGLFSDLKGVHLDARTRTGKWMGFLIGELTKHCGSQPSITEQILIDGLAGKVLRRHLHNLRFFQDEDPGSHAHILALENSIRLDCLALGLRPRGTDKVLDLSEYLKEKYGEEEEKKQ